MFNIPSEELGGNVAIPSWPVGEFGADEFHSLIRSMEASEAKRRLMQPVRPPMVGLEYPEEGLINTPTISGEGIGDTFPLGVSEEIVTCLKIPVIWGQFRRLAKEEQNLFLDRTESALKKTGNYLAEWLYWKLEPRLGMHELDKADLKDLLLRIATGKNSLGIHTRNSWIDIVTEAIHSHEIASILYREAASAGLIYPDEKARNWGWANPIIRECLASLAQVS